MLNTTDYRELVDRYGLPLSMLLAVSWFFTKKIWPLILRQMDALRKQVEESNARLDASQAAFLAALEEQRKSMQEAINRFDRALNAIQKKTTAR